ncbi:MAG: hypothetical protein RI562_10390 [Salibacter sp.]|jgi:hypothetical protein|uniref:hypothetical protein n=1 Tax=Salibacter sp. TaxID=2010995 RepID=UPI00287087F3|nr:hypothetical protein [Salibacter sp.]MDR9399460.1 hypothetical protein [Salibacter sp.]
MKLIASILFVLLMFGKKCERETWTCKAYSSQDNPFHDILISPDSQDSLTFVNEDFGEINLYLSMQDMKTGEDEKTCLDHRTCICRPFTEQEYRNLKNTISIYTETHYGYQRNKFNNRGCYYEIKSTLTIGAKYFSKSLKESISYLENDLERVQINETIYTNSIIYTNPQKTANDKLDSLCIQKGKGMIALWIGKDVWVREDLVE